MVSDWYKRGILKGRQHKPASALWIQLSEEDIVRLNGKMLPRPDMVQVVDAPGKLGMTMEQVWEEVRVGRLVPYRLFANNRWRWWVQLPFEGDSDSHSEQ